MDPILDKIKTILNESNKDSSENLNENTATEILRGPGVDDSQKAAHATSKAPLPSPAGGSSQKLKDENGNKSSGRAPLPSPAGGPASQRLKEDENEEGDVDVIDEELVDSEEEIDDDETLNEKAKFNFFKKKKKVKDEDEDEEEDEDSEEDDAEDEEDETPKKKKEVKEEINVDAELTSLFEGQDTLSEDFKLKAKTIFEAVLLQKEEQLRESILNECEEVLLEEVESYRQEIAESLDEYLDYIAEEWYKDNHLEIDRGLKTEIAESFITGLKQLFEDHGMEVPDESTTILEDMAFEIENLEEKLSDQLAKNIELNNKLIEIEKRKMIDTVSEGLSTSQKDNFLKLTEEIKFKDSKELETKLKIIKETFTNTSKSSISKPNKVEDELLDTVIDDKSQNVITESKDVNAIADTISRLFPSKN